MFEVNVWSNYYILKTEEIWNKNRRILSKKYYNVWNQDTVMRLSYDADTS